MSERRLMGEVFSYLSEKGFGFISEGTRGARWFFHVRDTEQDAIGRRGFSAGTPVSFELKTDGGKTNAINVRSLDPEVASIDLDQYWEYAIVKN